MQRDIRLSALAKQELKDSFIFYEQRQAGLGQRFEQAINKKLETISENPDGYRMRFRGWREAVVHRFPFTILFREIKDEGAVVVNAIFHTSRNPRKKYWRWPLDTEE